MPISIPKDPEVIILSDAAFDKAVELSESDAKPTQALIDLMSIAAKRKPLSERIRESSTWATDKGRPAL
ncbi:hypothetical protein D3C85_270650 [compost metagenome]